MKAFKGALDSTSHCEVRLDRLIHRGDSIRLEAFVDDRAAGLFGACELTLNRFGAGFGRERTTLSIAGRESTRVFAIQFTNVEVEEDLCRVEGSFEWNGRGAQFTGNLAPFQSIGLTPLYEPQPAAPARFTYTNWFDLPEVPPERPGAYQVVANSWRSRMSLETSGTRAKRLSASPERYAYWDGARFGPTTRSPALAEARYKQTKDFKRVISPQSWRGLTQAPSSESDPWL